MFSTAQCTHTVAVLLVALSVAGADASSQYFQPPGSILKQRGRSLSPEMVTIKIYCESQIEAWNLDFELQIAYSKRETLGDVLGKITSRLIQLSNGTSAIPKIRYIDSESFLFQRDTDNLLDCTSEQFDMYRNDPITDWCKSDIAEHGLHLDVIREHRVSQSQITCQFMTSRFESNPMQCKIYRAMMWNKVWSEENQDH